MENLDQSQNLTVAQKFKKEIIISRTFDWKVLWETKTGSSITARKGREQNMWFIQFIQNHIASHLHRTENLT